MKLSGRRQGCQPKPTVCPACDVGWRHEWELLANTKVAPHQLNLSPWQLTQSILPPWQLSPHSSVRTLDALLTRAGVRCSRRTWTADCLFVLLWKKKKVDKTNDDRDLFCLFIVQCPLSCSLLLTTQKSKLKWSNLSILYAVFFFMHNQANTSHY